MNITVRKWSLGIVAALTTVVAAQAALPTGTSTWTLFANGYSGPLVLNVDTAGNVTGTAYADPHKQLLKGFWTDSSGRLIFYLLPSGFGLNSAPADEIQIYTGYVHPCAVSDPNGARCIDGYFEAFAAVGGNPSRNVFGWRATKYFFFELEILCIRLQGRA
jgi:hypothetical protein